MDDKYKEAYMAGYVAALEKMKSEATKPYVDKDALIARYDHKIGINKAGEILRDVRHTCNGGKLDSCSIVLLSELEYWESVVDKKFKARL